MRVPAGRVIIAAALPGRSVRIAREPDLEAAAPAEARQVLGVVKR